MAVTIGVVTCTSLTSRGNKALELVFWRVKIRFSDMLRPNPSWGLLWGRGVGSTRLHMSHTVIHKLCVGSCFHSQSLVGHICSVCLTPNTLPGYRAQKKKTLCKSSKVQDMNVTIIYNKFTTNNSTAFAQLVMELE